MPSRSDRLQAIGAFNEAAIVGGEAVLNGLDLFSGIGGLSLALSPWVRPLAYCERDRFAQAVLLSRMRRRELPSAPIWDDITSLVPELLPRSEVDIIYGGFPCQDISVAGAGVGLGGSRSGLFFEIIRLARELRPRFVFLENVPAITVRGLDRVLLELTALGFDCRWTIVSAEEMGAPHLRERWFLLAYADGNGLRLKQPWRQRGQGPEQEFARTNGSEESLADSDGLRESQLAEVRDLARYRSKHSGKEMAHPESVGSVKGGFRIRTKKTNTVLECAGEHFGRNYWAVEPDVGRVANGIPARVDRLRGLGNAVVPLQAREAFERLAGLK